MTDNKQMLEQDLKEFVRVHLALQGLSAMLILDEFYISLASYVQNRERTLIDLLRSSVQEHCTTLGIDGEKGWEEYQKEHLSTL